MPDDWLSAIARHRLVPVVTPARADDGHVLADALLAGGLPCVEVALRSDAAISTIRRLAEHPELLVGAGTVLSIEQAAHVTDAGARFIVTPGLSPRVGTYCRDQGVPLLPGVATATDIMAALDLGLDVVKFFPAEPLGGTQAVAALHPPFPHVRFVPTGGVNATNALDYLRLDSVLAVAGTWMVPPRLLTERNFGEIAKRVREAVALVSSVPGG